jgi:tetratricopeptide (TPR) repeat protein
MAFLPHARCCPALAVSVGWLLLPLQSSALQVTTDQAELGRQLCSDWPRKDGRSAEPVGTRNNLRISDRDQNARKEYEEALTTYRELARKNRETYLPHVAMMLNNLGILDYDQNRKAEARKDYEEALKIYEDFAKEDLEQFMADVQRLKKLLEELPK